MNTELRSCDACSYSIQPGMKQSRLAYHLRSHPGSVSNVRACLNGQIHAAIRAEAACFVSKCDDCGKEFTCLYNPLNAHMQRKRGLIKSKPSTKVYVCDTCDSSGKFSAAYDREIVFIRHLNRRHMDKKAIPLSLEPFKGSCDYCPYETSNKARLGLHSLRHQGIYVNRTAPRHEFACDDCGKVKESKMNLFLHWDLSHGLKQHQPQPSVVVCDGCRGRYSKRSCHWKYECI